MHSGPLIHAHTIPRTALHVCASHVPVPCATAAQGCVLRPGLSMPLTVSLTFSDNQPLPTLANRAQNADGLETEDCLPCRTGCCKCMVSGQD